MRFAPVAATSVIALGAVLGGFTASSAAAAPEKTVQQRTVASAPVTDTIVLGPGDNNGNG
ncbi:hypothetical protein HW130_28660 [Streptomyces sp. PKU-EA00015]|uniref:hypothetical protein n=1 Tax=Streptomyces sp. PKU-EA00015 TaxID=2748326 RepID=UPI0015A26657|nr:hypothetical protein [Streptomyces sp. PKU-EA00015]NWF30181.1 hypothetical protein [Streptomyces sp. PKU-EA00015]